MNPLDHYYTIIQPSSAEFKDRGSRFLSYAFPLDNKEAFKKELAAVKALHPKAVHHCFAYRIGQAGTEVRSNDDGEPAGSAGKPILGQIDSKQLTNVGIVVVRYFGGTLLGIPGLIHAYKTAASLALQTTPLVKKPVLERYLLFFNYTEINEVMRVLKPAACQVFEQDLQLFSQMKVGIPVARKEEVVQLLTQVRGMEIQKSL